MEIFSNRVLTLLFTLSSASLLSASNVTGVPERPHTFSASWSDDFYMAREYETDWAPPGGTAGHGTGVLLAVTGHTLQEFSDDCLCTRGAKPGGSPAGFRLLTRKGEQAADTLELPEWSLRGRLSEPPPKLTAPVTAPAPTQTLRALPELEIMPLPVQLHLDELTEQPPPPPPAPPVLPLKAKAGEENLYRSELMQLSMDVVAATGDPDPPGEAAALALQAGKVAPLVNQFVEGGSVSHSLAFLVSSCNEKPDFAPAHIDPPMVRLTDKQEDHDLDELKIVGNHLVSREFDDDIRLNPEPSTMAMAGLGLLLVIFSQSRMNANRRRQQQ